MVPLRHPISELHRNINIIHTLILKIILQLWVYQAGNSRKVVLVSIVFKRRLDFCHWWRCSFLDNANDVHLGVSGFRLLPYRRRPVRFGDGRFLQKIEFSAHDHIYRRSKVNRLNNNVTEEAGFINFTVLEYR